MPAAPDRRALEAIRSAAHRLTGGPEDFAPLLDRIGDARYVLLGEASHGTHEFYRIRAEITKRLILDKGFHAVAVEADWPDAYRVNRYVRGRRGAGEASEALDGFLRFPQWMWRNADVLDFVGWLRAHNDTRAGDKAKVGFYGLDLYSLRASMAAVLSYLRLVDPDAARRAERRYACFDQFGEDPQTYGYAAAAGLAPTCEAEVGRVSLRDPGAAPSGQDRGEDPGPLGRAGAGYVRRRASGPRSADHVGHRVAAARLREEHREPRLEGRVPLGASAARRRAARAGPRTGRFRIGAGGAGLPSNPRGQRGPGSDTGRNGAAYAPGQPGAQPPSAGARVELGRRGRDGPGHVRGHSLRPAGGAGLPADERPARV
jgi:hypothetical protein